MADHEQKTMQELLKMSIKYSDAESKPLKPTEIDEERKEFLQGAINDVLAEDDYKKLVAWTNKFLEFKPDTVFTEEELAEVSEVFEGLNFLVEGMDVSLDFEKLGGLKHCLNLLRSQYSSIQWRAADLIANCVQNIPRNQFSVIEEHGFEKLLYLLKDSDVDVVMVKCLYALSSLLGGNPAGEKLFVDLKGTDSVCKLLSHENSKIRLKVALLLRKVVYSDTAKFVGNKTEIALKCIECLRLKHEDSHDVLADVLLTLISSNDNVRNVCQGETDFPNLLDARRKELQTEDSEKYEDVIEIYKKIKGML